MGRVLYYLGTGVSLVGVLAGALATVHHTVTCYHSHALSDGAYAVATAGVTFFCVKTLIEGISNEKSRREAVTSEADTSAKTLQELIARNASMEVKSRDLRLQNQELSATLGLDTTIEGISVLNTNNPYGLKPTPDDTHILI